jgi:glutathione S-transferase
MNIYSFATFNLTKLLLTAEELGMTYQLHLLDPMKGEHKSPEHLARHPMGKVPAVEINGQYYFESNSICRLMAELNGNKLYGNSPEERAHINEWVDMIGYHIGRWLTVYFFEELVKPVLMKGQDSNAASLKEAAGFLQQQLPVLDQALSKHAFITGDKITIADTIGFSMLDIAEYTSVDLSAYPQIKKWYNAIKSRPSYSRAMAKMPQGKMFAAFGK